jgi:fluoride ion exporter CrcB/FEX
VLFGPPGCFLRWYLSRFNYKLPGHWKWLPCGTFAANMIACLVDYIVGVRSPCMQNLRCMPVEDV